MKTLTYLTTTFLVLGLSRGFSKFGRTCRDIGCGSSEVCVMAETPCSFNARQDECGMYPVCQKTGSNSAPSCTGYICPPTKLCRLDGDTPKCVDDNGAHTPDNPKSHNSFATYNENPSAPVDPVPAYPMLPGQTTRRPAIRRPDGGSGGGYDGGSRGSGYPGQSGGYPSQGGGYPSQGGGYPSQGGGYPGQGGGYPSQGGGYPSQGGYPNQGGHGGYQQGGYQPGGYQQGGYQQGGNQQGGNRPNGYQQGGYQNPNNRYGQPQNRPANSGSNPLYDTVKDTLKTFGLFCLLAQFAVDRAFRF